MLQSERIHIETEFEDRVQFILQDYQYLRGTSRSFSNV